MIMTAAASPTTAAAASPMAAAAPATPPRRLAASPLAWSAPSSIPVGTPITAPGGDIAPGTIMQAGQWAISANNQYVLIFQTDSNLVLYQVIGTPPTSGGSFLGYPLWSTQTAIGPDGGIFNRFVFVTDGDLQVQQRIGLFYIPIWTSGTSGIQPARLSVQSDGNLVLYDVYGRAQWGTATYADLPGFFPTLVQGATGSFHALNGGSWYDLDNKGDNGGPPTVATLNPATLVLQGGYQYEYGSVGSGSGSISITLVLTGAATCAVTVALTGNAFFPLFSFSTRGIWSSQTRGFPLVQLSLEGGVSIQLSSFGVVGQGQSGVEINMSTGQDLRFENLSAAHWR
jgi:hypothetical protein